MLEQTGGTPSDAPRRDWAKTLDLDRTTIIKNYVDRFEQCMRDAEMARDAIKDLTIEVKAQEFSPRDISAMKKIANLRLKDQVSRAKEQLDALQRIGRAAGVDLFDYAAGEG